MPPPGRRISRLPSTSPPFNSTRATFSTSSCARWSNPACRRSGWSWKSRSTSLLEQDHAAHLLTIRQLKNLGVSMVLDNCGAGYSAASYLTSFPFDKIKIDRSVAQGFASRRDCAAVVASVLALARGLDIATAAKGVESREQFEALRAAGVDFAQGYLFGRPVPHCELDLDAAIPLDKERRLSIAASDPQDILRRVLGGGRGEGGGGGAGGALGGVGKTRLPRRGRGSPSQKGGGGGGFIQTNKYPIN